MRSIFFGTPEAAVPSLRALMRVSEVAAVVTRPDAPRGRSGRPQPSAVARFAHEVGIPTSRPAGRSELFEVVEAAGVFDVGVVVAFGMILRPEILRTPTRGFVNVHFSVLPQWRGAAPVQRAILAGDVRTGVTLMEMDEGLDTGPVISTWTTAIGPDEDAGVLTDRLAHGGADLLADTLPRHVQGRVATTRQDEERASYASKLSSDERWLGPDRTLEEALRSVRGLVPWPGAWIRHVSGPVRILRAQSTPRAPRPGEVEVEDDGVICGFADGGLRADRIQPAGKQAMDARDWVRGLRDGPGSFQ